MIHPDYELYSEKYSSPESDILKELNRETNLKVMLPRMLSGHLQGKLLEIISCILQPNQILEIGTYTGYSAIALSKGLQEKGILHTIDINAELEDIAQKYFKKAGVSDKIKHYTGNALDIIPTINHTFDLVFIDADKENYIEYFELVINKIRKGGIIIADNVLWSGKVLTETLPTDKDTKGIVEFNKFVTNDLRVENLLLPFRDGLMIMIKK
ncbi:MAG: O-methyltransferase [Bacteroidetes bacterium]|nr:O-methyltransferase [Bacteroidota bacterium]